MTAAGRRAVSSLPALAALFLAAAACAEAPPAPRDIVDRANKVLRGDSSHAVLSMTIVTPGWSRTLEIEGWNQGREKAFIVIHAPPKDKGNTTLRRASEMWVWLPAVERVMKIPPAMMQSSWQGSDFTYEDIVKADSIVKDYTHRTLRRERSAEFDGYEIEADPKPDAPVVWGKVLLWARAYPDGGVVPVREEDYNDRGELSRTLTFSDIRLWPKAAGSSETIRVPTRLECVPQKKPGKRTVLRYRKIEFGAPLDDGFFSLGRLQK